MNFEQAARDLLVRNTQRIRRNGGTYAFSVPSTSSYPFQWFWDSCFHAIVWARTDSDRAEQELRALLSAQRENGFLPHIIFWDRTKVSRWPFQYQYQESKGWWFFLPFVAKPGTSEHIQPPVLAQAVDAVWRHGKSKKFLESVLPAVTKYYRWWLKVRDPDHDGLLSIVSQFESGLDASPAYDTLLGVSKRTNSAGFLVRSFRVPLLNKLLTNYHQTLLMHWGVFHVEDVLVNSIFALNAGILARLHDELGNATEAVFWKTIAGNVRDALIAKCWDERRGAFFNLNGRREERSTVLTVASLMPLILPDLPREYVETLVGRHLTNPKEFWLPYPVPSVAANEPMFSADSQLPWHLKHFHWRGSTWMNTNWYLVHALRQHGYGVFADDLADRSRALVEQSGFREYYNPYTGKGLSAKNFGWSTLVADL